MICKRMLPGVVVLVFSLYFYKSNAILIPRDKVILYENGTKVTSSSFFTDGYNYSPTCTDGVCTISRVSSFYGDSVDEPQKRTVIIYKSTEEKVLGYEDWCKIYICQNEPHDKYLENLRNTSIYKTELTMPVVSDSHCSSRNMTGNSMTYTFDTITKQIELISIENCPYDFLRSNIITPATILISSGVIIGLVLFNKRKSKQTR